ncbi:MAG: hypothetical protein AABZ12_11185 [Planctomycetota bacterium]
MSRPADALRRAATLNHDDALRQGSLLVFPNYGQLVMTGDLHGHRKNFDKLRRFCDLERFGARHVILHELIHEDVPSLTAKDESYELLIEAARWKCEFPDQIHFLQSNHELAQLLRNEISKNGRVVTQAFESAVLDAFGPEGSATMEAILDMIRSYALAGRTPNRVFIAHSLPSPRELPAFDASVLTREPTEDDLRDGGSGHALVWGRYHTPAALDALREILDADFFLCGHQPQDAGFEILHDCMIILASEHSHGTFLTLDLSKPVTLETLTRNIRPIGAIA